MSNRYAVQTLMFPDGERLPVLKDRVAGIPLFDPTIYAVTQVRARNLASNTIEQVLRQILVFQLFLDQAAIDLEERLREGKVLDLAEIEDLTRLCRMSVPDIVMQGDLNQQPAKSLRLTSLESFRQKQTARAKEIKSDSASNRIRSIRDYLTWLVTVELSRLPPKDRAYTLLKNAGELVSQMLTARLMDGNGRNTLGAREGLAPEARTRLLEVIAREAPDNPWKGNFTKSRNELVFRFLHSFGLRRGELLNIKVSDIDFRKEVMIVVRRADDPEDPRRNEPRVKTRDRKIPIASNLCQLTHDYVVNVRRHLPGARKHEFLFVADKTGAPMSLSALNKCFNFLRKRIPGLPQDLSPHVLRHTWNDNFSVSMDKLNTPAAEEQKMRSYLMGWSETSGTAVNYTRRHTREMAKEVSLLMQATMTGEDEI